MQSIIIVGVSRIHFGLGGSPFGASIIALPLRAGVSSMVPPSATDGHATWKTACKLLPDEASLLFKRKTSDRAPLLPGDNGSRDPYMLCDGCSSYPNTNEAAADEPRLA